jgi:TBC1 domain family member 6
MQESPLTSPSHLDQVLTVEEAIREAMETPSTSTAAPVSTQLPPPHLPLRKASAHRLQQQAKKSTPTPLWAATQHQVRGFNPSPVQATPHVDNIQASSEHAFAGRDGQRKRAFRPPLHVQEMALAKEQEQYSAGNDSSQMNGNGISPVSPLQPPLTPQFPPGRNLRSSKSLGDGLRGWRNRFSAPNKRAPPVERDSAYSVPVTRPDVLQNGEVRDSFKSTVTSTSSFLNTSSIHTEHSSMTGDSSHSDFVKVFPNWPEADERPSSQPSVYDDDGFMSVEDAIGMYADGFSSAKPSMDTAGKRSFQTSRPTSQPSAVPSPERKKRPDMSHRRSQSAGMLLRSQQYLDPDNLTLPRPTTSHHARTFTKILDGQSSTINTSHINMANAPRDRYGFKKVSLHVTLEDYDAWNATYSEHVERRSKKWHSLMKSYGLATDKPFRFPPKSDKIKRYVRKGIPPNLRGAAWFWYAGGPGKMAKEPGLYRDMLKRVSEGELSDNDREHIERDLNRTFPDNVKFKPDPTTTLDAQADAGGGAEAKRANVEPETPIVQALRRVLQAFAVHNPNIGYCQSLNFIAGLLLLFLDQDEEKAFVLLNIVTTTYLPGTHGVALEGANIDIAVLMSCIKDSLPTIWAKLDDKGPAALVGATSRALRMPTISLATTAWFMSLFVGTLPIESVLRVWDCLFFEGSKTLFRIALAIFKTGEKAILSVSDSMEIFQMVQTAPRAMLDVNGLMETCFKRRGGFGGVSQEMIEKRREERRQAVRDEVAGVERKRGLRRLLRR